MAEKKRTANVEPTADGNGAESVEHYDLDPRQTTSIVNGNRIVVLDKGINCVTVARSEKA